MKPPQSVRTIEHEIRRAKAEALGRAGERLERALAEFAALDRRLDRLAPDGADGVGLRRSFARKLEARNRVRDAALRLRLELEIQREAIGLSRHGAVARNAILSRRDGRSARNRAVFALLI